MRFLYDGLVFACEWCIFLVLILAMVNAVLIILRSIFNVVIVWFLVFFIKIIFKIYECSEDECYNDMGAFSYSARLLWDAIMFAFETTIFLTIVVALFNLAQLIIAHLKHATVLWIVLFCLFTMLKASYGHTNYQQEDWNWVFIW